LRNNANFAAWKQAVGNQLLLAACIGIVDGSDMEPSFRTARAMAARSVLAGSAPPTATERIPDTDFTVEQLDEWRKWQKREEKVQGVIRTTVSDGIVIDILDMNSAKQMGDYILAADQLDSPEEQAQVRDALASIRLKDDPSAEEMEIHLERFNSLLLRARTASLKIDEAERVERFLATLPKALAMLRLQFRLADPNRKTWLEVSKQYNLEAADRKRPSGTGNQTGFAHLSKTKTKGQTSTFRKMNVAHEECWNCHKSGHFARDCWTPKNDANNKKFK
jgi:hypothetical protein